MPLFIDTPIAVATRHTAEFVCRHVSPGPVIEVGCGAGHLAITLHQMGFQVTAIDQRPEAVEAARSKGVNALVTKWLDYRGATCNAVLFTRSLHHMHELEASLALAKGQLTPDGSLVVEDFDFEALNPTALSWLRDQVVATDLWPLMQACEDELIQGWVTRDAESLKSIYRGHQLHSAFTMQSAIAEHFTDFQVETTTYLYRYLIRVLPNTQDAAQRVAQVKAAESQATDRGDIPLIGLRIVARNAS